MEEKKRRNPLVYNCRNCAHFSHKDDEHCNKCISYENWKPWWEETEKQTDIGDVIQSCKEKGETKVVAYLTVIEQADRDTAEKVYRALEEIFDKRPQGKWIKIEPEPRGYAEYFRCSNCSAVIQMGCWSKECDYDYCPSCGARMEVKNNGR